MKHLLLKSLLLLALPVVHAQKIKEKLVATFDAGTLTNSKIRVSANGNYCIEVKTGDKYYWYTQNGTLGPFTFIGGTYGNDGEIKTTESKDGLPWYYRNAHGTKIYGPVTGKMIDYNANGSYEDVAVITSKNDSLFYYIDGRQVHRAASSQKEIENLKLMGENWSAFSPNGNCLYTLKEGDKNNLYKNGRVLNSSTEDKFCQLHINNNGTYVYALAHKPPQKTDGYDYMFSIHTENTVLSPVRTVWDNALKPSGGYYYTGDDNGPEYIAVNDRLFKNINDINQIIVPDKKNFAFAFTKNGISHINANGTVISTDAEKLYLLNMDKKRNFAFFGFKDYYLYKYINGKKQDKPLTRFSVRPRPLYINPKGEAMLYFKTQDSAYIYRDDKQLISSGINDFQITEYGDFFDFGHKQADEDPAFYYIKADKRYYITYNSKIWQSPVNLLAGEDTVAESIINNDGFCIIYKLDSNKYGINVNNVIFKEVNGPEAIIPKNCFLSEKELIFFGIKNNSIYQYSIKL